MELPVNAVRDSRSRPTYNYEYKFTGPLKKKKGSFAEQGFPFKQVILTTVNLRFRLPWITRPEQTKENLL